MVARLGGAFKENVVHYNTENGVYVAKLLYLIYALAFYLLVAFFDALYALFVGDKGV